MRANIRLRTGSRDRLPAHSDPELDRTPAASRHAADRAAAHVVRGPHRGDGVRRNWLATGRLIDSGFLLIMAGAAAREIITGGNWGNLKVVALVGVLSFGNVAFHLE